MLAKIKPFNGVGWILGYNEIKIKGGKAECVLANGFVKDLDKLTRKDKSFHFNRLISLNERATKNSVHISISFFPADKLSGLEFQKMVRVYMEKIGFGRQPYLAYRHYDTRHPHFHIVSTNIKNDGSRIDLRKILRTESFKITREMEDLYSLQKTDREETGDSLKVEYGRTALKPAIKKVLDAVLDRYKYRSIDELNAILRIYNVKAYAGREGTRLRQYGGLLYGALDANGKSIGKPLKASSFAQKPTLKNLEKKFALNGIILQKESNRVKTAIDWTLLKRQDGPITFLKDLEREDIIALADRDRTGQVQRIFYLDRRIKAIYDGDSLGSNYNVKAIYERCGQENVEKQKETLRHRLRHSL